MFFGEIKKRGNEVSGFFVAGTPPGILTASHNPGLRPSPTLPSRGELFLVLKACFQIFGEIKNNRTRSGRVFGGLAFPAGIFYEVKNPFFHILFFYSRSCSHTTPTLLSHPHSCPLLPSRGGSDLLRSKNPAKKFVPPKKSEYFELKSCN